MSSKSNRPRAVTFSEPPVPGQPPPPGLVLGIAGFDYADLHRPERLRDLHAHFLDWLGDRDAEAKQRVLSYSAAPDALSAIEVSKTIVAVAPHVGAFVARLFGVEAEVKTLTQALTADEPLFEFRKQFLKRRVLRPGAGSGWSGDLAAAHHLTHLTWEALAPQASGDAELQAALATLLLIELESSTRRAASLDPALSNDGVDATATDAARARASVQALRQTLRSDAHAATALAAATMTSDVALSLDTALSPDTAAASRERRAALADAELLATLSHAIEASLVARHANPNDSLHRWAAFHAPHKQHFDDLVPLRRPRADLPELSEGPVENRRQRVEPFALTDARAGRREVATQVEYCIYCHERDKDSCSKGLRDKQGGIKRNPLGVQLNGCPLDEKIGEAHALRRAGEAIGTLATIAIDNPMMPGTGHRICNDCMKGCIYQAQEPVNIPQIETRVLTDVLDLPWGFEIYSLLTRWNPLNVRRPFPQPYIGKNVMVVGLGPAGYTLSHYLINEGFGVVAVDGLKLEPLPLEWVGSATQAPQPIYDYRVLKQPLESRTLLGFGGVSEYGITVRWDKSFLAVMYLNLLRQRTFRVFGGVRFGGTLTVEDAWELGFDHIAIAAGAGRPTQIDMKNYLIRGVRKASDLLMALQLTGAYKRNSLANLQVRLPAIVIGGGLTAIDTATELLSYYVVQAERSVERYDTLSSELGEAVLRQRFDTEELEILDEVVAHGRALLAERAAAAAESRPPRLQELLQQWGGVTLVYRRSLQEAPAYRLNHEEISKAFEEGVRFVEHMAPLEAHADAYGAVEALSFARLRQEGDKLVKTDEVVRLPARTVGIAAGTRPNVSYENEYPGTFELDSSGYLANHSASVDADGRIALQPTTDGSGFFTSYHRNGRTVSYYGDNHPKYAGNVVKAMASAKHGYRKVAELFQPLVGRLQVEDQPGRDATWLAFARHLNQELQATVQEVKRLAPDIVEVIVKAPFAARKFQPGQFYRFQNFEAYAPRVDGTPLLMEGLALTGAAVDRDKGLLSTIALEMGTSSRMCAMLQPGEPVLLMGPTGAPTETPGGETVLLAGGGLGNAVLFSIARALKQHGSKVIYFAGYKRGESLFKQDEVESGTDQIIWSTDSGAAIQPRRPQDQHFRGNIVQAMLAYQNGEFGERRFDLRNVDRIIAIGSDRMMAAVKAARHGILSSSLKPCHKAIGSINSPMQCMMKAVCAQCLQRTVDPETGIESMVYTCFNQDLELDRVDFGHLAARLRQNSAQEKLANLWFDRLLKRSDIVRV